MSEIIPATDLRKGMTLWHCGEWDGSDDKGEGTRTVPRLSEHKVVQTNEQIVFVDGPQRAVDFPGHHHAGGWKVYRDTDVHYALTPDAAIDLYQKMLHASITVAEERIMRLNIDRTRAEDLRQTLTKK